MNYRHIYHAGNFADVFKHILLISLAKYLLKKEKPFCYLDTHAGTALYDLHKKNAQKTLEFKDGVHKLWHSDHVAFPTQIQDYLHAVKIENDAQGSTALRYYPGSPALVRQLLRPQDRMILTELHIVDTESLKQIFLRDKQVAVHHLDGYQALKAFLPPKESRGLVLIDPPFEQPNEFETIVQQLQLATTRFRTGTYAVWYPIKDSGAVRNFYQKLKSTGIRDMVCCEMHLPHLASASLSACGMVVINPPWQWKKEIAQVLPMLCEELSKPEKGHSFIRCLVAE